MPDDSARTLFDDRAQQILRRIFLDTHPVHTRISAAVEKGTLLWGVPNLIRLGDLHIIQESAENVGDTTLYLTFLEADYPDTEIPFSNIAIYRTLESAPWWSETALVSPQGKWGILCRLDWHSVAAGCAAFIDGLNEHWPTDEDTRAREFARSFLTERHEPTPPDSVMQLVTQLLEHLYGPERAAHLIAEALS